MNELFTRPEVEFRVGEVRVSLWYNFAHGSNDKRGGSRKVTIERQSPPGNRATEYTSVLDSDDIPKAILALKKAHDYIQARGKQPPDAADYQPATTYVEGRIP